MRRVLVCRICHSYYHPRQTALLFSPTSQARIFLPTNSRLSTARLASGYPSGSVRVHEFFRQIGQDTQVDSLPEKVAQISVAESPPLVSPVTEPGVASTNSLPWPQLSTPTQIFFEADVLGQRLKSRPRLVDDERYINNHELWLTLLRFRRQVDGNQGVWDVFNGMRARNVEVPTRGEVADRMWGLLVHASIETDNLDLLWSYINHLYKRHGRQWEHLYRKLMSAIIIAQPSIALKWHRKLADVDLPATGDLRDLVLRIPPNDVNISILEGIWHSQKSRKIYDEVVPPLIKREEYAVALKWHKVLTARQDLPSNGQVIAPLVAWLTEGGRIFDAHELSKHFADATVPARRDLPNGVLRKITKFQPSMNEVFIGKNKILKEPARETLCARAYATRMFSVSIISATLSAWGIQGIGPVAFRELLARSGGIDEIYENLNHLKLNGIIVQPCTFVNLILKLADEGNMDVIDNIVSSDQHPDTYDDVPLMERLLQKYVFNQDMPAIRRILAALSFQQWDRPRAVWNKLLCACFSHDIKNWSLIDHILEEMFLHDIPVDEKTGTNLYDKVIASYTTFNKSSGTDLIAMMELSLKIVQKGYNVVPVIAWRTMLYHLGRESRLASLEYLCLQLASVYDRSKIGSIPKIMSISPQESESTMLRNSHRPYQRKLLDPPSKLSDILDDKLIHDIIMWGFKTLDRNAFQYKGAHTDFEWPRTNVRGLETMRREASYARGVALLRVLRGLYRLPVLTVDVVDACRLRLLVLFAPYRRLERANRTARKHNPWTLRQMVRGLNLVWGTDLFHIPTSLLEDPHAPAPGASIDELAALAREERAAEEHLRNRVLGRNWRYALRGKWSVVDKRRIEQMSYRIIWH